MSDPRTRKVPVVGEIVQGGPLPAWPEANIGLLLADRAKRFSEREAVRFRTRSGRWQELTFPQLHWLVQLAAVGLADLGVKKGDKVLIVSPNGVAVLVAELALCSLGAVSVNVFSEYAPQLLGFCVRDSGARIALVGSTLQQRRLLSLGADLPLERIVVLDEEALPDARSMSAHAALVRVRDMADDERERRFYEVQRATEAVAPDDDAFLLYTSGTTGRPKGVPLTHRMILSQQAAIARVWDVGPQDVFLSYLPWHHCFGAFFERFMALWSGAELTIDDSRGRDLPRLLQNLREVKPTLYFSVPRVYQTLVDRARVDKSTYETLVKQRLRFVFTAAAPLPQPCYEFFEQAGIPVHEGWGLTETSPCATLTRKDEPRVSGSTGFPLPGTEVKLERVDAVTAEGVGEILVRGPQVMRGYHRDPAATERILTSDGFLRSGDLGRWTPTGLQVHGRVDGVFKLLNGEKVPSGEVESRMLAATPLLEHAVVLGAGAPFTTALAWVAPGAARAFLEAAGLDVPKDDAELTRVPELRRAITEAIQSANLLTAVPYERVRRVALVPDAPDLAHGELTPTQKVVRGAVIERKAALVDALKQLQAHPQILEIIRSGDSFTHA